MLSQGSQVPLNTHPFELMLDPKPGSEKEKSWIFIHNGTIREIKKNKTFESDIKTHGNTDSEFTFCYIMGELRKEYRNNGYSITTKKKAEIIQEAANKISSAYPGSLNFIMSDGYRIYCYYGGYDGSGGLHYLLRTPPYNPNSLRDKDTGMTISLDKENTEIAALIASRPLTDEKWTKFEPNTLMVFEDGKLYKP